MYIYIYICVYNIHIYKQFCKYHDLTIKIALLKKTSKLYRNCCVTISCIRKERYVKILFEDKKRPKKCMRSYQCNR